MSTHVNWWDLWVCQVCRAVVPVGARQDHAEWHMRIGEHAARADVRLESLERDRVTRPDPGE